jgi:ankyrin repeat protein
LSADFQAFVNGLRRGDFSRLDPFFAPPPEALSPLASWVTEGRFATDPGALNEALACACFNGRTAWVAFLLDHGADLVAGAGTGLNGFHWASNRGQLETVRLLLERQLPLETRNSYGGTILGGTVWASVHEPQADHLAIIEELLKAGARVEEAEFPSGRKEVDRLLERYGASG